MIYPVLLLVVYLFGACSSENGSASLKHLQRQTQSGISLGGACLTPGAVGNCESGLICSPITSLCEYTCNSPSECNTRYNTASNICTQAHYCQQSCQSQTDCNNSNPTCVQEICYTACKTSSQCPEGQQCLGGYCQYQTCKSVGACNPGYQNCYNNSYCTPVECGGTVCGLNESCSNENCQCGSGPACSANLNCSALGPAGVCQCGSTNKGCNPGETCQGSGTAAVCQCGSNPSCGDNGICSNGNCTCNGQRCAAGQSCLQGKCATPIQCGGAPCVGACIDNQCVPGFSDNTCGPGGCLEGQACFSGHCLTPCGSTGNYCLASETCGADGQCHCGSSAGAVCSSGTICANTQCITKQCGDGYLTTGEVCDEGDSSKYLSAASGCPSDWSASPQGNCQPNKDGAGNGNNGHCAKDCSTQCVLLTSTGSKYWPPSQLATALNNLTTTACDSGNSCASCSSSQLCPVGQSCNNGTCQIASWPTASSPVTQQQCPNGLGIWVKNSSAGTTQLSSPLLVNTSVAIYGGFAGTENTVYDRTDPALATPLPAQANPAPLGRHGFSGTILDSNGQSPILYLGDGSSGKNFSLVIDGFQLKDGSSTTLNPACTKSSATPASQAAGGVTVCSNINATLQNLRIVENSTTADGGGIKNLGGITLRDSIVSLNTAQTSGGAISHNSSSTFASTIERVTIYGNGFYAVSTLSPLCTIAGNQGVCPTGSCTGGSCPNAVYQGSGGGVAAAGTAPLQVYASKFNLNQAYYNGGGIYSTSPLTVASSVFTGNWASFAGGGLYLGGAVSANLSNLTVIENAAYNAGGGGIYDVTTGASASQIVNSLFRNNKGLRPFNDTSFLEWAGNRNLSVKSQFWPTQINSILSNLGFPQPNIVNSSNLIEASYVDMCPAIAYNYGNGQCDGTSLCGTLPAMNDANHKITFNTYTSATNVCDATEFSDCIAPTYRNCSPVLSGKTIPASSQSIVYSKDYFGNPNTGAYGGAYQSECERPRDCPPQLNLCINGSCGQCSSDADCSGRTPFCVKLSCVECRDSNACSNGATCTQGACPNTCGPNFGVCPPGQACLFNVGSYSCV